jgi:hypothetical protein
LQIHVGRQIFSTGKIREQESVLAIKKKMMIRQKIDGHFDGQRWSNPTHISQYNRVRDTGSHWTTPTTNMVTLGLTQKMKRQKHTKRTLYSTKRCNKHDRKVINHNWS